MLLQLEEKELELDRMLETELALREDELLFEELDIPGTPGCPW